VGLILLPLYGVSELLSGIFPIDVRAELTTAGAIHNIVGNISFFCFPIAAILLSLRIGKDGQWRSLRRPALALSIVVVLTVILTIAGANLGIGFGVAQRVANVAVMVWMFIVALRLRSVAQGALAQQLCGRVEIPAATIQQSFGEGQNAPVAAGTHAGQSATPPTRAPLPRTSAEESGRGLHSVSNWESANARWAARCGG
jgi:hypothetical protein